MAIRLALLDGHYRADREWTGGRLPAAEARLARWRAAVALPAGPSADGLLKELRTALANDLDTPSALAAVDRWVAGALSEPAEQGDPEAPRLAKNTIDALLGVV
jgi:L-cysteine:1D-myo-inositol 2-amino-2-deoxy-alpha-D-glucopyranoside ligase